ncbi:hypothetical protein COBT_003332 [Conglomerata obtusa]
MKNSRGDNVNPEVFPYMDTLELKEIKNLKLSLEIMCLNSKNKPNDICLLIVLSNDIFYVTYKEKLENILVMDVTPYKNQILEMLRTLGQLIYSKNFLGEFNNDNMIIYDSSAYKVIKEKNACENEIEIITSH